MFHFQVLSGKFPTEEFQNTYEESSAEKLPDEYQSILSEIKKCGRNCVSVCCTGAFIIETMLAVLVRYVSLLLILYIQTNNKNFDSYELKSKIVSRAVVLNRGASIP